MKAAYNQNDLGLYLLFDEVDKDDCENCIFYQPEKRDCILLNFGEDIFEELPKCWNAIFIPESLSNIFEL